MMKKNIVILLVALQLSVIAQEKAEFFPLSSVRLQDELFLKAQQNNLKYILALNPDKLLAPFLKEAGITPKAAMYGNWESRGLGGQTAGHYLSSLSLMYAATGEPELKRRLDYMIDELDKCQQKNANGYVGGIPEGREMWIDLANGKLETNNFSLNKKWVPWYNLHKLYAGLIDTWVITKNAKAKQVLIKLADWCLITTSKLSDAQMQEMLRCEHGGMNEVLAEVASLTGDEKYIKLAQRFSHQFILEPLLAQKDALNGLHANTQIPKVIGFMRIGELTNNQEWKKASNFFWETVVNKRSVSIGGNSVKEHFNKTDDFSQLMHLKEGPETCNSYNMLRLTKHLFQDQPKGNYIDYYERTTYNHILASQHPEHGGLVYLTPLRAQHYRVYSKPELDFWCCVGTGIENHAKYGEMIYTHQKNDLFVNLFIASTLNWKEKELVLTQSTKFPFEETTHLKLELKKAQTFTLYIRKPVWIKEGIMKVWVNNEVVEPILNENGYYALKRNWKAKDEIKCSLPMDTKVEPLPDNSSWISFVHGPIVLAAATSTNDLRGLIADDSRQSNIAGGPLYSISDAPIIISKSNQFKPNLENINKKELIFGAANYIYQDKYKGLKMIPFFKLHDARYMLYWPVSSLQDVEDNQKKWLTEEQKMLPLETSTIDFLSPGEQQAEVEHNLEAQQTENGMFQDKFWRAAKNWFSYELKNDNNDAKKLRVTYYGAEVAKGFGIYINEKLLKQVVLPGNKGEKFFDEEYILTEEIIESFNSKVLKVKFAANEGNPTARIFTVRLLK